jgi:hypothetical protein
MRLTILTLIAALGLAASALSARAAPVVLNPAADHASSIVQVWGGCGPGFHPVPGHWSPYRGWVPPHCRPNWGPYGGYYGPYAGYRPYWGWHRYYW